jgi:RNA polymerase sigma factor (sigma-70 family)
MPEAGAINSATAETAHQSIRLNSQPAHRTKERDVKIETALMTERDDESETTRVDAEPVRFDEASSVGDNGPNQNEEQGAASIAPNPLILNPVDPFEHEGDLYAPMLRSVSLLSREEEESLGRAIQESRIIMTDRLAQIPAAVGVFVDFVVKADARERPITDALFAPFESFPGLGEDDEAGEDGNWRDVARTARRLYSEWRTLNATAADSGELDAMRSRLAKLARSIQPGLVSLREALHVCRNLDERVAAVEKAMHAFHADILAGGSSVEGFETLLNIQNEAGVDLTTLRECCKAAASAHARYSSARDRMVNANLRLAYFMAHRVKGNGVAFEDLVQEAMIGLMRAVDKFDYRKGYKFSTYAVQWIRQTTTRAIAESSRTIRVAAHAHDDIVRLRRLARDLEQRLGREPSEHELAKVSGLSESKIAHYAKIGRPAMSLDYPAPEIEDSPLSALVVDPAVEDPRLVTHDERLSESVAAILDTLPAREAFIIRLRHGIGGTGAHTLEEIGRMLGITRERTRQLEARAFEELREKIKPDWLEGLDE